MCRAAPRGAITLNAGFIGVTFCGFGWLTYANARDYFWASAALGVLTFDTFLLFVLLLHRKQQKRGPVFVYDKGNATVELPRDARTFELKEVDCLGLVTGYLADAPVCQLQLHLRSGERFLLVAAYHGYLDQMSKTLTSRVGLPVRHYVEGAAETDELDQGSRAES